MLTILKTVGMEVANILRVNLYPIRREKGLSVREGATTRRVAVPAVPPHPKYRSL